MKNNQLKIGSIVVNEYNNVGKIIEFNGFSEAVVEVFNYCLPGDIDYCDRRKCRLATEKEIISAFSINYFADPDSSVLM